MRFVKIQQYKQLKPCHFIITSKQGPFNRLLLDDVVSQIALPQENENWQREMLKRAKSAHQVFLENAWSLMPLLSRINSGPSMLRYIDRSLACLHYAGFTLPEADQILHYFDSYIYGFTLIELQFPIQAENYLSVTERCSHFAPKRLSRHASTESSPFTKKVMTGNKILFPAFRLFLRD